MNDVEAYILDQEKAQREVLDYLYQLLMSQPGLTAKIRYKIPFYYRRKWVCYTNPREGGVELVFLQGQELSNEQGLLQARGRKMVAGVVFHKVADIPEEALMEMVQEAFLLDEET